MPIQSRAKGSPGRTAEYLLDTVKANLKGKAVGICSVCSANPFVLRAAMRQAKAEGSVACVESTSNQVNQFGGYTGMQAADFAAFVAEIAVQEDLPAEQLVLGGDHLGPHVWRREPAEEAMAKAAELVRSYVAAGFIKIHLDTSMRCADDLGDERRGLSEEIITRRAAALCRVAEQAAEAHGSVPPVYVVGTEVPVPGGEESLSAGPQVTAVPAVEQTLALSRQAFQHQGQAAAWDRVIGLVVQPAVEFADATVFPYQRGKTTELRSYIEKSGTCAYEAHSTDYQTPVALREMVEDHFAILKVGPWLTFAFREAVFALSLIEEEWLGGRRSVSLSRLRETLESAMLEDPSDWKNYYQGDEAYLGFARRYSYSDRSRYYWPKPAVQQALQTLLANLTRQPPPMTLFSQYLPFEYEAIRAGQLSAEPGALIEHKIRSVLRVYSAACGRTPVR